MASMKIETHIKAPVERVFQQATNFSNAPEFIEGITKVEMLTDGPVGVGTRFRETRIMFKREATEEMEVTDFRSPNAYTLGCENHGCRYQSEFQFTPVDGGTRVSMTFEAQPLTTVAKIMSILTRPMMKSVAKHCLKDLEDIKRSIEG